MHGIEPNNIKLNQMMELIEFLLEDFKTDPKHKSESNICVSLKRAHLIRLIVLRYF